MALTLWISFGGPRPTPTKLPLSIDGCSFNVTQPIPAALTSDSDYFYLYRISYLWVSPVSSTFTGIVPAKVCTLTLIGCTIYFFDYLTNF